MTAIVHLQNVLKTLPVDYSGVWHLKGIQSDNCAEQLIPDSGDTID